MNTNMNAMTLEELEAINDGDTMDHVAGALTIGGAGIGSIAGAPGVVIGAVVGAAGGGTVGGIFGYKKIRSWLREHIPFRTR